MKISSDHLKNYLLYYGLAPFIIPIIFPVIFGIFIYLVAVLVSLISEDSAKAIIEQIDNAVTIIIFLLTFFYYIFINRFLRFKLKQINPYLAGFIFFATTITYVVTTFYRCLLSPFDNCSIYRLSLSNKTQEILLVYGAILLAFVYEFLKQRLSGKLNKKNK